jgi:glycosyltransferase involved in cell wall biosynthesis
MNIFANDPVKPFHYNYIRVNKQHLAFSFIVPVYNRPKEIEELLESLVQQTNKHFEIVIVEDGSELKSDQVADRYSRELNIRYHFKANTGPALSRNFGCQIASGNYFIFVDSDCVLPPRYFDTVHRFLTTTYVDAFGGPDQAHESFTITQKAINYSMTSFFTTGGIRGGGEKLGKFNPRSFNMGFSREVFEKTGGFPSIRFAKAKAAGEDLDLSIQIIKLGFKTALIKDAFVYHKRRTNLKQFYNQVYNFGFARISVWQRHPESLKPVHFAPAMFTMGSIMLSLLALFVHPYFFIPILFHALLLLVDSTIRNRSVIIGCISVVTSYAQLLGYGFGFISAVWKRVILRKNSF